MPKRVVLALIVVGLIAVVFYLLFLNQYSFSTEKWINEPEKRSKIVDDFITSYGLYGMDKAEVTELLGQPENLYFNAPNNIVYYVGNEPGFMGFMSIDSLWLIIWFDKNDKAVNYEFKTD